MSSAGQPPEAVRPSVFISYASEDRTAARTIRETLTEAGLDVWYDESELGGGDAWDQKIRRQIRECEYFMPLISAATDGRKEGYFRREWRLATERTMDMADDVLFLLPIAIDSTTEATARVPDKFLGVQWLRAPGGKSTPALLALVRRLRAGEHTIPPRSADPKRRATARAPQPPPPGMPPFPHPHEKGGFSHGLKYAAEVCWWVLTSVWMLFNRLPRWLRIVFTVWLVIMLLKSCDRDSPLVRIEAKKGAEGANPEIRKAVQDVVKQAVSARQKKAGAPDPSANDFARFGLELVRAIAKEAGASDAVGRPVAIVPFARGIEDEAVAKFATSVFTSCYGQMLVARPDAAAIAEHPPATAGDDALVALGKNLKTEFVLTAGLAPGEGPRALVVRLLRTADGTTAWSGHFGLEGAEPAAIATQITANVLGVLPAKK